MKTRKLELGNRNIIGARVTQARLALGMKQVELLAKLQLAGIDISSPALSLLEGQKRPVSDIELNALANILNVSVDWLLGREKYNRVNPPLWAVTHSVIFLSPRVGATLAVALNFSVFSILFVYAPLIWIALYICSLFQIVLFIAQNMFIIISLPQAPHYTSSAPVLLEPSTGYN